MASKVELRGFREVRRELEKLPPRVQKNLLRGAVTRVAREIRDDARENAPVRYGNIRRGIKHRRRRGRRGIVRASVIIEDRGPRRPWYWFFVEFGHVDRGGGHVPADPFLTRAFEGIASKLDGILSTYLRGRFSRIARSR